MRLAGRRFRVEVFEEARPDALCGQCRSWGHIEAQCPGTRPARYSICAGEQTTKEHGCPVEGCHGKKGRTCAHVTPKCANCRGPHFAITNECCAKRDARLSARGWRSPLPKRGGRAGQARTTDDAPQDPQADWEEEKGEEVYHDAPAHGSEMEE